MDFKDLLTTPTYSLDIETTGLDPFENKIWSVGMYSKDPEKSFESFLAGVVPQDSTDFRKDFEDINRVEGSPSFTKEQVQRGSFNDYYKANNTKSLTSLEQPLNRIADTLEKDPGILLIQNINFEKKFLKESVHKKGPQGLSPSSAEYFSEKVYSSKGRHPVTENKSIIEARKSFQSSISGMINSNEQGLVREGSSLAEGLQKASEKLESTILKTVERNLSKDRPISTALDLQDFSRLYLNDLFQEGLLDKGFLRSGTNVDFLVKELLGDSKGEVHTSLSDAKQQTEIFEEIISRRENLKANGVSAKDIEFAGRVSDPVVQGESFLSGVAEQLQKTRIEGGDSKELETNLQDLLSRKRNLPENGFSRDNYVESVLGDVTKGDDLSSVEERVRGESKNLDISKYSPENYKASTLPDSGGISKKNKLIGGAALALVGANLLSSGPRRDREEFNNSLEQDTYSELYENLYAGQALADWQQRNNHHRMN